MFQNPFSATSSLGPEDDGVVAIGAPGPLRERVLAHVRGEPIHDPSLSRRQRRRSPLGLALALAIGAALGSLFALAFSSDHTATPAASQAQVPRATLRREGARAELLVRGMPEPPAREVYEVWLVRDGNASPKATDALFTVTKAGSANVDVPGDLSGGVSEVMVSNEPLGGSEHPTGQVLMRIKVPRAS